MMKTCSKCKTEYPATSEYFQLQNQRKDGLDGRCKSCCSKYYKQYYASHKDERAKVAEKYYAKNRKKINKQMSQYYYDNKEKLLEYAKQYQADHKIEIAAYERSRYAAKKKNGCEKNVDLD